MTVKPDPPPQVDVGRDGLGEVAASRLFQLFAAQTLPAGSIDTSVIIWMLPLWKTWMTSPVLVPAGCPLVLSPASSDTERPHMLPTQTSSLPSIFNPHGMLIASPVNPIGEGWVPSGRIILTAPVGRGGGPLTYLNMCAVMSLNCSMMEMPSGSFGCGVRKSMLLATQTFSFESSASARTPMPARKLSTLVGSLAGNRTTVSDEELATQTRFCESMTMSNGDFSPATFTMRPSLIRPPGKNSSWLFEPSAIQTSPFVATPMPIRPRKFSLNGKSLSLATGLPLKSMTRILPLKLMIKPQSLVTAVPQPTPSMPMPAKPVIAGESAVPLGLNLITPPPVLLLTPDCEPGIQFWPLQRLPSASNMNRPLAYTPPPAKQRLRAKSGGVQARYGTKGALR